MWAWILVLKYTVVFSGVEANMSILTTPLSSTDMLNSPKTWRILFLTGTGLWLQCLNTSPRPITPHQRARTKKQEYWKFKLIKIQVYGLHTAMIGRHFSSVKNNICYFGDKVLFSRCVLLESAAEWVSNNVPFILFSVLLKTFILPLKFYLRVIFQIFFFFF